MAHIANQKMGVDLTFRDVSIVASAGEDLPDGALLINPIRFYGVSTPDFQPYVGDLPDDASFSEDIASFVNKFNEPDWTNSFLKAYRWENGKASLHAELGENGKAKPSLCNSCSPCR